MNNRGVKLPNQYSTRIRTVIDAPKAVWEALAVSLANRETGVLDRGQLPTDTLMAEWQALYDNGIVPQRPNRKRP